MRLAVPFALVAALLLSAAAVPAGARRGLLTPFTRAAQQGSQPARPPAAAKPAARERAVPFGVGEVLTYDVSWSSYLTAGTATMTVKEKKLSFNSTAYYIVAEARPTPLLSKLYTLYYKLDTLLDSFTLLPQRGSLYSEEGDRRRFRVTQFDRVSRKAHFEYRSETTIERDYVTSPVAQDVLSALYVLRVIPFRAGDRMTMPIDDNGTTYTMRLTVGAPEYVQTPAINVSAWKLTPVVLDDKNQPVSRNVVIWVSNDSRRLPVKFQVELPVGSFVLALRSVR